MQRYYWHQTVLDALPVVGNVKAAAEAALGLAESLAGHNLITGAGLNTHLNISSN